MAINVVSSFVNISTPGGLVAATAQRINQSHVGLGNDFQSNDRFGGSFTFPSANTLAVGDLDNSGRDDLIIGTPHEDGTTSAGGTVSDAGAVSIRYGGGVGTFSLAADATSIHPGQRVTWTLSWKHPRNWHDLDRLHLRIADAAGGILAWVRWDEASNTFSVYDGDTGQFGPGSAPGSRPPLLMPAASLETSRSKVVGSGPQGLSVTLTITLHFTGRAPAGKYQVELLSTDDRGFSQGFEPAGVLTILGAAQLGKELKAFGPQAIAAIQDSAGLSNRLERDDFFAALDKKIVYPPAIIFAVQRVASGVVSKTATERMLLAKKLQLTETTILVLQGSLPLQAIPKTKLGR